MKYTIMFAITVFSILTYSMVSARTDNGKSEEIDEEVVIGTAGDDMIDTGEGDDNISAGAGNDTIKAGDGNDLISGGPGDDKITGGAGDDYIIGGEGNDTVKLGPGNDYINLGPGDDTLVINIADEIGKLNYADGGEGNDTVVFVAEDPNELLKNDIIKYYEKEKLVGRKIVDMDKFNVAAGLSNFENVAVAVSYSF